MSAERSHPYQRREYRSWLRCANPVAPKSTAFRHRQHNRNQDPDNNLRSSSNCEENAETLQNTEPLHDYGENIANENDTTERLTSSDNSNLNSDSDSEHSDSSSVDQSTQTSNNSYSSDTEEELRKEDDNLADVENESDDIPNDQNTGGSWKPTFFPDLEQPLAPNINCTKFECLLMVLTFSFRHGLTQVATEDLFKMINTILGGQYIPESKYMIRKIFGNASYKFHFYCEKCGALLGDLENNEKRVGNLECQVCQKQCSISDMNNGCFFITFSVREQLKRLFENLDGITEHLKYRWNRTQNDNILSDVMDGEVYKNLCKPGNFLSYQNNISGLMNTDGACIWDSSRNTLWPVYLRINEIPPSLRFNEYQNLLCGLWFGNREPSMPLYLSQFVTELKDLYSQGFMWSAPNGDIVNSKLILLNCVVDSKAKPPLQNIKQFNGYFGCGYCLHPGVIVEDHGKQVKYPMNEDLTLMDHNGFNYTVTKFDRALGKEMTYQVDDRKNNEMRRDMQEAEENRTEQGNGADVKGVKGISVLCTLVYFDIVFGFAVDYLHCVLLGVVRLVTGFWFDTSSHGEDYYLNEAKLLRIDSRLLGIKPPTSISRRPRTLHERNDWKGNEWRAWLLYYSLPCIEGILPHQYVKHHCILVSAIHILLQDKISREELDTATWFLGEYCVEFMRLYSRSSMNYNVHLLLHLGKCVSLWGPLYCYSCFSFESSNGQLIKLVKGSKGVLFQIAEKYLRCQVMPKVVSLYEVSERILKYCEELLCLRLVRNVTRCNTVTALGSEKFAELSFEEEQAFNSSGHEKTCMTYERLIFKGELFHSKYYARAGRKSNNSTVKLKSGEYGVIKRIIDARYFRGQPEQRAILVLIEKININQNDSIVRHGCGARAAHIKMCGIITYSDICVILKAEEIQRKVILIECENCTYIAEFPNVLEKD